MRSHPVLNSRVDILRRIEVESLLADFVRQGKPRFILTANTEMYYKGYLDQHYARVIAQSDLAIVDSVGIAMALGLYDIDTEIYPGVELAAWLLERYSVYIIGAKQQVLDMIDHYNVVGKQHGYFAENDIPHIIADIRVKKPQVLLVGLGVGKQEEFIVRYKQEIGVPLMLGVGGAIDVISGVKKRAPKLVQRLRIEWLYRLLLEPTRIKRQCNLVWFWLAVRRSYKLSLKARS